MQGGNVLSKQQTREQETFEEAIPVPLDGEGFHMVKQDIESDQQIRVESISKATSATGPRCHRSCRHIHDQRPSVTRDGERRGSRVKILLWKRRFRCFSCQHPWTEEDQACGYRRRTTARVREAIGHAACSQPVAPVAKAFGVAESVAQDCCGQEGKKRLEKHGVERDETQPLETPTSLGLDACSRRKGHRDDPMVADVKSRKVLAMGSGRKREDVQKIFERFKDPDAVKAVSMDMSASSRPAGQRCVPKAQMVVDHVPVIQHVMKGFRTVVSSDARTPESNALLEGKPSLFFKAQEDLPQEHQQERQKSTEQLPGLKRAWQLKEA